MDGISIKMDGTSINLMFVGYNRLFREGLRLLVGARFNIVKEADSFEEALKVLQAEALNVHLLIGDPGVHMSSELDAISEIGCQFPQAKIIVLAPETNQHILDTVLRNGAGAVLSNDISATAMLYCIEIVLLGERIVPTILPPAGRVAAPAPSCALAFNTDISGPGTSLSARERQILLCLLDGMPNKLIARQIGMTEATVKVHLKILLRKLGIQNGTQAAVWALNHGFLQNDRPQIEKLEASVVSNRETYPRLPMEAS